MLRKCRCKLVFGCKNVHVAKLVFTLSAQIEFGKLQVFCSFLSCYLFVAFRYERFRSGRSSAQGVNNGVSQLIVRSHHT